MAARRAGNSVADAIDRFHAVELIPPPPPHRTRNPNYHVGTLADLDGPFDAGIYVEVIEHLTPATLRELEERLISSIERLGDRLDRVFEKNRAA